MEYINALTTTPTFAYAEHDLVVHGFTTTSRKTELTGEAFDPFPMNRALNQAMHDDRFDYCADLPRDFSEARIFETIEQYVSRDKAVEWQAWYKKFQDYYRSLGDVIG